MNKVSHFTNLVFGETQAVEKHMTKCYLLLLSHKRQAGWNLMALLAQLGYIMLFKTVV